MKVLKFIKNLKLDFEAMVFCSVVNHPSEVGLCEESADPDLSPIIESEEVEHPIEASEDVNLNLTGATQPEKTSVFKIITLPGVPAYALSFFALKLVNYSFFFWLPYFLHNQFNWSDSTGKRVSFYLFVAPFSTSWECDVNIEIIYNKARSSHGTKN